MAKRNEIEVQPRSPEFKLMLLRIQLFTAMQTLEGSNLEEFWKLIEEVQACRKPP